MMTLYRNALALYRSVMNSGAVIVKKTLSTAAIEDVLSKAVGRGRVITLNRPKALNSLNLPMIHKLTEKLKEYELDPSVKLVILRGMGDKAFCAGGDVVAVTKSGLSDGAVARDFFKYEYRLNYLIGTYEIPFVSLINGITMGGITRSPSSVRCHPLEELENELLQMPEEPTQNSVQAVLDRFHKQCDEPHEFSLAAYMEKIDNLFDANSVEEIFEKLHSDNTSWSQGYLDTLRKMSPTSLKVTFRQLQEGGKMGFKEIFTMEYRLAQRFVEDKKDFYEGIRAVLLDKDNNPKWDPASLKEVTQAKLDWYFSPLPSDRELVIT